MTASDGFTRLIEEVAASTRRLLGAGANYAYGDERLIESASKLRSLGQSQLTDRLTGAIIDLVSEREQDRAARKLCRLITLLRPYRGVLARAEVEM